MAATYLVSKFLTSYFSYEIFMKHLLLKNTSLQLNIGTKGLPPECVSQVMNVVILGKSLFLTLEKSESALWE